MDYSYPRELRLRSKSEISAVYGARVRESRGPLTIYALPNDLGHPRLGLSVPKRVGTAPKRNRIKRLLRESFRLFQHDLPSGYDVMVTVRPHETLMLADYQRLFSTLMTKLHRQWQTRSNP